MFSSSQQTHYFTKTVFCMGILRFQSQNTVYTKVSIRIFGVNGANLKVHMLVSWERCGLINTFK